MNFSSINKRKQWVVGWFILVHFSGLVGILFRPDFFIPMTPLNLLINGALLFWMDERKDKKLWAALSGIAVIGWGIEWVGVHQGWIFGNYQYGDSFGFAVDEIPLLIGLNWAVLVYVNISFWFARGVGNSLLLATATAITMTALDALMEFVAPAWDFWNFKPLYYAPLHNFIGWFVCAFVLAYFFVNFCKPSRNPVAGFYLILQFLFFTVAISMV